MNIPLPMEFPPPEILKDAILHNSYTRRGDYSATEILEDPRCVVLKREHPDDVSRDVSKNIKSFVGTAVHELLEHRLNKIMPRGQNADGDEYWMEIGLNMDVEGSVLSGTADMIHILNKEEGKKGFITDWKNPGASKYMMQDFSQFYQQLQIYKLMANEYFCGCVDVTVRCVLIFSDWNQRDLMRFGNKYPQQPILTLQWRSLPDDLIFQDIVNKIQKIKMYEKLSETDRPDADPESVWNRLDKIRLFKPNGKRAVSGGVFDARPGVTEDELWDSLESAKPALEQKHGRLEARAERKGRIKCHHYCPVCKYCTPYQKSLESENEMQIDI